ncbi:hypothetical protein F4556_000007 [Kitasatospora gansuensis]|uniref:Uncharacterized protein n=1 Tax=Kitasatospora gansuensis TaxID=258050 RepID=A0A7W7WE81_9ACTN|nr:hypothetical protein [Kitasatospora gansuensis]
MVHPQSTARLPKPKNPANATELKNDITSAATEPSPTAAT